MFDGKKKPTDGIVTVQLTRRKDPSQHRGMSFGIETAPRDVGRGTIISGVTEGSVAEESGQLKVGDLILSINTREVLNVQHDAVLLALDVCGTWTLTLTLTPTPTLTLNRCWRLLLFATYR
jgi:C-terminal processing protease CtpA/Prc